MLYIKYLIFLTSLSYIDNIKFKIYIDNIKFKIHLYLFILIIPNLMYTFRKYLIYCVKIFVDIRKSTFVYFSLTKNKKWTYVFYDEGCVECYLL